MVLKIRKDSFNSAREKIKSKNTKQDPGSTEGYIWEVAA